jgi:hypothetical protein
MVSPVSGNGYHTSAYKTMLRLFIVSMHKTYTKKRRTQQTGWLKIMLQEQPFITTIQAVLVPTAITICLRFCRKEA